MTSNIRFVCLDFLLTMTQFIWGTILIHFHLPHASSNMVVTEGKICLQNGQLLLSSTQNKRFVPEMIVWEVGSLNHIYCAITPNFKGKSLHTV